MKSRISPVREVLNGQASVTCSFHEVPDVELEDKEIDATCEVLEGINEREQANTVVRFMRYLKEDVPDQFSAEEFARLYVKPGRFRLNDLSQEWKDWARPECFPLEDAKMESALHNYFGSAPDDYVDRLALYVESGSSGKTIPQLAGECYRDNRDASDYELVKLALEKGASLTPEGREVLRQHQSEELTPPTNQQSQPKNQGFAAHIGASNWCEIELSVLATGIKYRKAGTDETFIEKSWGNIGLRAKHGIYGLLGDIAKGRGTYPNIPYKEKRRAQTHDLNMAFKNAFGLPDNPFSNHRIMGTQSRFGSITWGGR